MKKIGLILCVVFILSVGFVGCGKKDTATNQSSPAIQPSKSSTINSTSQTTSTVQTDKPSTNLIQTPVAKTEDNKSYKITKEVAMNKINKLIEQGEIQLLDPNCEVQYWGVVENGKYHMIRIAMIDPNNKEMTSTTGRYYVDTKTGIVFEEDLFSGDLQKKVENKNINESPQKSEITNKDYLSIGFDLMEKESIGFLKIGTIDKDVVKNLHEAEEKSEAVEWEADALEHQTWYYRKNGIELNMVKRGNNQAVAIINIKAPCNYRTTRNIGIGSTKDEVLNVYKNEIDPNENAANSTSLVAGTVYGGIIFEFENSRVSSIFIGAAAE